MIITLTGNNNFMLSRELEQLKSKFISESGDLAYEKLDGEEVAAERLIEAANSLPFLIPQKLVVLRAPSAQKQFTENIESILKAVPETTQLVILEPKIDKRSVYFKVLKAKTDFRELNELDQGKLSNWIVQYAKDAGGTIKTVDAQYLIERIGQNQQMIAGELDKLLNFEANIARQSIDLLTEPSPQSTIFTLLDAAFSGKAQKVVEIYLEQRKQKVEPQQIIAMLAWQLHVLAVVKTAGDKSIDQIAKEAKLNPFVVRKTMNIARQISLPKLKKLIAEALKLDVAVKSENIDTDEALQEYMLSLTAILR